MYRYYKGVYYRWLVERREHSERSEANDHCLFKIPRYIYIYIYIYIYVGTLAAIRSTTLRSRLFNRYGRRRHFSWRQTGRRQRFKPYTYNYRTQEAPRQRQRLGPYAYCYRTQEAQLKPDCRTEGRRIGSRTTLAYSFLYNFFILCMYLSIYIISLLSVYSHISRIPSLSLLIFQIHKLLHAYRWGARHVLTHCVCLV